MARQLTVGFETQLLGTVQELSPEGGKTIKSGTVNINNTLQRSGLACAECPAGGVNYVQYSVASTLGRKYYYRVGGRLLNLPAATGSLWRAVDASGTVMEVAFTKEGKLEAFDGVSSTHPTGTATLEAEHWYMLEIMLLVNAAGKGKFSWRLNGAALGTEEQEVETRNTGIVAIRQGNISGSTAGVLLDDLAFNDDQGASENSWCQPNRRVVFLKPKEDISRAGFIAGGGAITNLFDAVNNTPPVGVASPGTNASQIGSANANNTDNVILKTAAYTDSLASGGGGLGTFDIPRVVMAYARGGVTSANSRGIVMALEANPVLAEKEGFTINEIAGTEPTAWRVISNLLTNPTYTPAVTKSEGVKLKIRKGTATTDNEMIDLAGVMVEYEFPEVQHTLEITDNPTVSDAVSKTFKKTIVGGVMEKAAAIYQGAGMEGDVYEIGAADAPYGVPGEATWNKFEEHSGKKVGIVHYSDPWMSWEGFGSGTRVRVDNRGAINSISMGSTLAQLNEVAEEKASMMTTIEAYATKAAEFGKPMFFRPWWEANGTWWAWGRAPNYVKAWQVLYTRMNAIAPNLTFFYCPNTIYDSPSEGFIQSQYPGNAFVDWTGFDAYSGENPFKKVSKKNAKETLDLTYRVMASVAPSKPMMLGEIGASEYGISKPAWITELLGTTLPAYPRIKAVCWYNSNILEGGGRMDWQIESTPEGEPTNHASQAAYAAGIASSYYLANHTGSFSKGIKVPIPQPNYDSLVVTLLEAWEDTTAYLSLSQRSRHLLLSADTASLTIEADKRGLTLGQLIRRIELG